MSITTAHTSLVPLTTPLPDKLTLPSPRRRRADGLRVREAALNDPPLRAGMPPPTNPPGGAASGLPNHNAACGQLLRESVQYWINSPVCMAALSTVKLATLHDGVRKRLIPD